jgi:hypothetical protein
VFSALENGLREPLGSEVEWGRFQRTLCKPSSSLAEPVSLGAADPRREVGARVQTEPHFLTSEAQAHCYFGTAAKTTLVPGTVLKVETDSSGARAGTRVEVRWELPGRYLTKSVPIRSVTFLGCPASNPAPTAGATTNSSPAVAGKADEDAAR